MQCSRTNRVAVEEGGAVPPISGHPVRESLTSNRGHLAETGFSERPFLEGNNLGVLGDHLEMSKEISAIDGEALIEG